MEEPSQGIRIRFGVFELDTRSGELRKAGTRVSLQDQPLKILTALLERPGEVVTREDLKRRIWPEESFGDFDHAVNVAVAKLRAGLADSADAPRFVETLPRRGYRFIFPVTLPREVPVGASSAAAGTKLKLPEKTTRFSWTAAIGATIVIIGLAVSGWWFFHRKTHVLTEKDTVVLADFTNRTGDAIFDDTLKQALATALAQSPFLNILSDQRVSETLRMMDRSPGEHITLDMAREICQRTGSTAVLAGSIAKLGSQYVIGLNATNCSNGDSLAREDVQAARKEEVLNALGKDATSFRKRLGESLTSIQKFDTPLEQATTSSLEALKAFTMATRSGGATPYTPLLQHAIELDPNFALAYAVLSDYYDACGEAELASQYAQKAFDHRAHATEQERLGITATYYAAVLGDLDRELPIYPVLEQMYPRNWAPWNNSASELMSLGDYTRALNEGLEALRLNPNQSNAYLTPGRALLALNRRNEVKNIAKRAQAHAMDVPGIHILVYLVAFLDDDTKEMEAQLTPLLAKPDDGAIGALIAQSNTEAYFGRLRNSLGILKRGLEIAQRGNFNEAAAQVRDAEALREAEFGNPGDARRAAAAALTLSSGRNARLFAALALARAGDVTRAQAIADELNRQFPSNTLFQRYWLPTIRGSIELARRNPSKALAALRPVSYELGDTGSLAGNLYPAYVRGQAYLRMRQGTEAADEFQKLLDHRSIVLNSPLGALAYLGLARAYALQSENAKAQGTYQDFLTLWKDADPDIPILVAAKSEYAKLK
jgi:DNA-binding winged helix-turn-helix (wHTH) protein